MSFLKHIRTFLIFTFFFSSPLLAQLLLRGMAPLEPGNYWKYYISEDGMTVADSFSYLLKDSVVKLNGSEYFVMQSKSFAWITYSYMRFSSDSFYIRYDELGEDSIYKYLRYNCKFGDSWAQHYSTTEVYFTVTDTLTINAWGKHYKAKEIHITDNGLISIWQLWTDSLGLMSEFSEAQYIAGLVGCVINGMIYGDTSMYITSVDEDIKPINEYKLYQNYPNPFNPTTTISYFIPFAANVKLKIYNILSEEVATVVDEYENSGDYSVKFNGKGLASGIYIYRIEATSEKGNEKGFVNSKSMVLIK